MQAVKLTRCLPLTIPLLLTACVTAPEQSAQSDNDGLRYLAQGVESFANDRYVVAAERFNDALAYFRSIDHPSGTIDSHINLIETALRVGHFPAAEQHLDRARQIATAEGLDHYQSRLDLLAAKRIADQGELTQAIAFLTPHVDNERLSSSERIAIVTLRTDLAIQADANDANDWLTRLAKMLDAKTAPANATARLSRLRGDYALAHADLASAERHYRAALRQFRATETRPDIATTLEHWAELAVKQQDHADARDRLRRALYIRLWLLNRPAIASDLQALLNITTQLDRQDETQTARAFLEQLQHGKTLDWDQLRRGLLLFLGE